MAGEAILVTGAAGFIGMHVINALAQAGRTVIGIDSFNDYYAVQLKRDRVAQLLAAYPDQVRIIEQNFAEAAALEQALKDVAFDSIIHLGAQPGVRYSIENPAAYIQSNLVGHANMLELARHRAVRHMVYASSSSVYGGNRQLPFRVEDRADHPVSLYAATKRADELLSESYSSLYRIPQTGLRFFTVYGPWGRPDMAPWLFTDAIIAGRPIRVFNNGDLRRDFTYIDDIVAGILAVHDNAPADDGAVKAGGSAGPHRLYNIGNNRPEELMDLIRLIEEACGKPAQLDMQPMQVGDVHATYADISAISGDLGFAPTTSLAEGIPRFVNWFRDYMGR